MLCVRVMSMHVLLCPIRRFVLCAIAFALGKLRVVLKVADQSCASSHFNSQNTHSQFRNSHFTHARFLLSYTSLAVAPQCIVIGPVYGFVCLYVCVCVCGSVITIT